MGWLLELCENQILETCDKIVAAANTLWLLRSPAYLLSQKRVTSHATVLLEGDRRENDVLRQEQTLQNKRMREWAGEAKPQPSFKVNLLSMGSVFSSAPGLQQGLCAPRGPWQGKGCQRALWAEVGESIWADSELLCWNPESEFAGNSLTRCFLHWKAMINRKQITSVSSKWINSLWNTG